MGANIQVHRSRSEWLRIRRLYESTPISGRALAKQESVSYSTLSQKAMVQKWRKPPSANGKSVAKAASELEAQVEERAQQIVKDQLQPFIEKHKTKITKRAVLLSNRGLTRLERLWQKNKPSEAKVEAEAAKTLETLVRVGRVSLGMGDGSPVGGSVSLNILTNQAAVQVISPENKESDSQQ